MAMSSPSCVFWQLEKGKSGPYFTTLLGAEHLEGDSFLPLSGVRQELENGALTMIPLAEGQQVRLSTDVMVRREQQYSATLVAFLGLPQEI